MGTISKGILGGFSGKVGTVVGSTWKGITIMRSKPGARKSKASAAQLDQQKKFALVIRYLQPMVGLLSFSFKDFAIKMSGFNHAVQYNLQNAIKGTYPDYSLDPSLLLLSRGNLPNVTSPTANCTVAGQISFAWEDNSGIGKAIASDMALLIVYSPDHKQCIYKADGAARSAKSDILTVNGLSGLKVQTYIGFMSNDGRIATSIYTGEVIML